MGKKLDLDNKLIENILHEKNILSIRRLAEKYSLNKNVIIRIINEKNKFESFESLCCIKTNKIFYDTENKSGILTKHLKNLYNNEINLKSIEDYKKYFTIKCNNKNYISYNKYIQQLNIKFENKVMFDGLYKYHFKTKDRYIFFIDNNKISNNSKIKPILFFKLKNRYDNSIFIYEDEWVNNRKIVESKIKMILNISNNTKIFARNCLISEISSKEKNDFLEKNHIQGSANSSLSLGAFYDNKLVAIMTFLSNRNMTNDSIYFDYELNRFATDINYHVIAIGSKLFSFFLKRIKKNSIIVSYGDRRFVLNSKNNLYRKLNFTLNQISKHDYFYIKKNSIDRTHKITMQMRHKKLNTNENEREFYKNLEYTKIWDCGKYRFTYKYE